MPKVRANIREFRHKGKLVAVLLRKGFQRPGEHAVFVSAVEASLQLGGGIYPKSHYGAPHEHDRRSVMRAHFEEMVHLDQGRMKVNLYGDNSRRFASLIMRTGDTIHLISGGHSFEMLTACRCIEVKQGPYAGPNKRFFTS